MKDLILAQIKKNKPASVELPEIPVFETEKVTIDAFIESVKVAGAAVVRCPRSQDVIREIKAHYPDINRIANTISSLDIKSLDLDSVSDPKELHPLDLSIIQGDFGVIENGAIWTHPDSLKLRAIPFLAEHLVVLLSGENIVSNMHEAYARLADDTMDYGVFIAGPSKTADIEQCLVIGAQGAKSLLVVIAEEM